MLAMDTTVAYAVVGDPFFVRMAWISGANLTEPVVLKDFVGPVLISLVTSIPSSCVQLFVLFFTTAYTSL